MKKEDFIYALWAVMAVQGLMREADILLRQHKDIIYRVAGKLSRMNPRSMKLYRGVLLSPDKITGNIIKEPWPVEFISFSEDKEIACWFASGDSLMGSYIADTRPDVKGYMIEFKASTQEILFHWTWHKLLKIDSMLNLIDHNLKLNGWHTDLRQYVHNVKSQKEVIIKPTDHLFELSPKEDHCTLTGPEMDKKFLPPWIEI